MFTSALKKEFLDDIKNKIQITLNNDPRTSLERASHKKPKQDFLLTLSDVIQQLMQMLYTTGEQTSIINNSIKKKYMFGDVTYIKFLKNHLPDEYITFKKNRYFAGRLTLIVDVMKELDSDKKEFEALNFTGRENATSVLDLTLDDYITFKKQYIETEYVQYVKNRTVERCAYTERTLRLSEGSRYIETEIKADTLDTVLNKEAMYGKNELIHDVDDVLIENSKETNSNDMRVGSLVLIDFDKPVEHQKKQLEHWLEKNDKNLIEVVEDVDETRKIYMEFPKKEDRQKFMQVQIDSQDKFQEEFIWLKDLTILKCADLKSYGIKDKMLIILEELNSTKYRYYRYYKGKVYFLEVYGSNDGSPTIQSTLRHFEYDNYSADIQNIIHCLS